MPFCPNCRDEYREGFETCSRCGVALTAALPEIDDADRREAVSDAVGEGRAAPIATAGYDDALSIESQLAEGGVVAIVSPDPAAKKGGTYLRYIVSVLPEDEEHARRVLAKTFENMLAVEGLGGSREGVVDMDKGEEIECPACGHKFTGVVECPECGLFLGALE
jgi:hypothetical protein